MQQTGPEHGSRHVGEITPMDAGCECRTDYAPDTGPCHRSGSHTNFLKRFNYSDMSQTANAATAKCDANPLLLK